MQDDDDDDDFTRAIHKSASCMYAHARAHIHGHAHERIVQTDPRILVHTRTNSESKPIKSNRTRRKHMYVYIYIYRHIFRSKKRPGCRPRAPSVCIVSYQDMISLGEHIQIWWNRTWSISWAKNRRKQDKRLRSQSCFFALFLHFFQSMECMRAGSMHDTEQKKCLIDNLLLHNKV